MQQQVILTAFLLWTTHLCQQPVPIPEKSGDALPEGQTAGSFRYILSMLRKNG